MAAIYYFLYYIFLLLGYSFMYSYIFYNMIFFNHFAVIFLYVLFLIPFISYLCKNFQNLKDLIIWWVRSFFFYACGVSLLFIVFYFIRKNFDFYIRRTEPPAVWEGGRLRVSIGLVI